MNAQISFEEFSELSKKAFLYEATYNPNYAFRNRFHGIMTNKRED
jgi:hypothetical protein